MSSLSATVSEIPNSEPVSLDSLDYDDWEGQFEFVGNNTALGTKLQQYPGSTTGSLQSSSNDTQLDDLNLSQSYTSLSSYHNRPILIDHETFLSIQPDDESILDEEHSGPPSGYFIENALKDLNFNGLETFNNKQRIDNQNHSLNVKNLANKINFEDLNNIRNKLISTVDLDVKALLAAQQNNNNNNNNNQQLNKNNGHHKMNEFSAELCDNLSEQLEILQRQVSTLADTQNNADDHTNRTKAEYAVLQAKYHIMEEHLRDAELRAEDRLIEEQKRHRDLLERAEREALLQNENCQIQIQSMELEVNNLREELQRLRVQCDKQTSCLDVTQQKLEDAIDNFALAKDELIESKVNENRYLNEKLVAEELMLELSREVERLKTKIGPALPTTSSAAIRLEELHEELDELRQTNKVLYEQNDELKATVMTRGIEEGRSLLNDAPNSLANELGQMNERQLHIAYQDKEDENLRLKHYIDTILLNIVENYPQLLEVKTSNDRK